MLKNVYLSIFFTICFVFCHAQLTKNKEFIKGEIQLDSTVWESTVYLSYIPTFDHMYTISYDMIISASEVNQNGHFSISTSFLPEESQLYRIHIPKKNTSPISLIIGGAEENHMFLLANKTSAIIFQAKTSKGLFDDISFIGDTINSSFQEVMSIVKSENNIDFDITLMQHKLIKEDIQKQLKQIAQESTNPLVALYAFYKSDIDINNIQDQEFINSFNKKWNSINNPYFNILRNDYNIQTTNKIHYTLFISTGFLILLFGYFIHLFYKKKKIITNEKQLQSLSIQERKILALIQQGLSNKEISEECHIGLSTVKSHISSIYSKLNVKSRKEVIKI